MGHSFRCLLHEVSASDALKVIILYMHIRVSTHLDESTAIKYSTRGNGGVVEAGSHGFWTFGVRETQ